MYVTKMLTCFPYCIFFYENNNHIWIQVSFANKDETCSFYHARLWIVLIAVNFLHILQISELKDSVK